LRPLLTCSLLFRSKEREGTDTSHFTEIKLNFSNTQTLVAALIACGIPQHAIEVHETPQPIIDYLGHPTRYHIQDHPNDKRFAEGDVAHVIVRRGYLGAGHNDFGVYVDAEKGSVGFLCDFARCSTQFNEAWMDRIAQRYAVAETKALYADQGQEVIEQQHEGEVYLYVKAG
jgi:hypothetical protein